MIPAMDRSLSSSKLLLVADNRPVARSIRATGAPVRRYRIARLRLEGRPTDQGARFEHLKRVFD